MTEIHIPPPGVKMPAPRKSKAAPAPPPEASVAAAPPPEPQPQPVTQWRTGTAPVGADQLLLIPQNATLCGIQRQHGDHFCVSYVAPVDAAPSFYTHRWISVDQQHEIPKNHTVVGFARRYPATPGRFAEPKAGQYALCIASAVLKEPTDAESWLLF